MNLTPADRRALLALAAVVAVLIGLELHAVVANASTFDEPYHLAFGGRISDTGDVIRDRYWQDGLMPWSWIPAALAGVGTEGPTDFSQIVSARLVSVACLLGLAGLLFAAGWRFGGKARTGALAAALVLASPNLLAHGALATTDVPAALAWTLALVGALAHLRSPTRWTTATLAAGISLALWTKYSSLLLVVLIAGLLPLAVLRRGGSRREAARSTGAVAVALAVGLLFLHLAPPSTPSLPRMGNSVEEANRILLDWPTPWPTLPDPGLSAGIPLPVPESYALGIQLLRAHEQRGHVNMFLGEHRDDGWWFYFPLLFLLKTPAAGLLAFGLALGIWIRRRRVAPEDVLLLGVPLLYVAWSTLGSRLHLGFRHALVVVPALQLWLAMQAGALWDRAPGRRAIAGGGALLALAVVSTWSVHPNYLSFFSRAAGGPPVAHRFVNKANFDWGQEDQLIQEYVEASGGAVVVRPDGPIAGRWALSVNDLTAPPSPDDPWADLRPEDAVERVGFTWFVFEGTSEQPDAP